MLVKPLVRPIVRAIAGNPTASLGSGFSPTSLFLDGSKGVVYDNNDLSSFYLDSAGTTAATVNGLVGLQLDKSLANITARRNLASYTEAFANAYWTAVSVSLASATAPDGATTATTMTATGAVGDRLERNGIIAGATGTHTYSLYIKRGNTDLVEIRLRNSTTATDIAQSVFNVNTGVVSSTLSGTAAIESIGSGWYRCSVTSSGGVTAGNSLRLYAYCGTSSPSIGNTATIWGAQLEAGTAPSTYQKVVQEEGGWMLGNHRYQTTTGSKPVLRGTPTGANTVSNPNFDTDTLWSKGAGWTIGSGVATATAATGFLSATMATAVIASRIYRITYTIVTATSGSVRPNIGGIDGTSRSAAGTYVDYITAFNTGAFVLSPTTFSGTVDNIEVVDVSAGQVTAPYGLQYDGVDDFLQTAAVDFTATDKMFVCAGVRKLADGAAQALYEFSADSGSNNGGFGLIHGLTTSAFTSSVRGTVACLNVSAASYASPFTLVATQLLDISQATAALENAMRVNGASITISGGASAGTGNFGNFTMFFGRRNGASLPYNGLDFGFVICGKTLTSTQISQTERYIAQRTGISL